MNAVVGQMVTYKHLHRGGYGYETSHPAVVVKVHGKRATIRVARIDPATNTTRAAEAVVTIARLHPRTQVCAFERVLNDVPNQNMNRQLCLEEEGIAP